MKQTLKKIYNKYFKKKRKKKALTEKEKRHSLVGPPKLWKMKQQFQIDFLKQNGMQKHHKFLDVGCGTLRGGIPIIEFLNEENYYGIDVRSEAINEGKNELRQEQLEHKNPNLILFEDFKALKIDVKFDMIFAFSVLIHLKDDIAKDCFSFISEHLDSKGSFYANVNCIENEDGQWQGFPVVFRSIDFYKELAQNVNLGLEVIGQLKDLGHVSNKELGDQQFMLRFYRLN
ncbi:hypothetical protein C1T31_13480 [Hanstruepera neustonica]|uniref:Methyltransferase type 12 domain-containing protein n=1 Tax=Hanstruepera neustonica TaxID=1445657 RepID=A0A2K1DVP7_9FLAO|nr:class I SAM-dependent methyltransferase [Hanstruepera neustonica]PNQ72110.1 hypothetical protein C1T31_13480 [Hanstruepera neustonica]